MVAFSRKTIDNFSHDSSYHNIFSDNEYNFVVTQAVNFLHQGSQQGIKAMLGQDFHYCNQGRGLMLCTLGDKHNLQDREIIRKKNSFRKLYCFRQTTENKANTYKSRAGQK